MFDYISEIDNATVYDVVHASSLQQAKALSQKLKNNIYLKREDEQCVHSFKIRGAYNKISHLDQAALDAGIIASSAGNHAQGVAFSASKLGIKATIVMPKTTPPIKVNAVKSYGAHVILHGDTYDDAFNFAMAHSLEHKLTFIHPYDDPLVIAGQGTIGKELLTQLDHIDYIFIPVGGGGLVAGITAYIKAKAPHIKIIGVEPDDAACLSAALRDGERTKLSSIGIFVDGVAVRQIGEEPFRVVQHLIDDSITSTTDEVCAAIKDIFEESRSIPEPAGALALAGAKRYCQQHKLEGKNIVSIVSGANVNFDRLKYIAERTELGEEKEALLAVKIPEQPGSFRTFCKTLGPRSITEFNYRHSNDKDAYIFVGIQLQKGLEEKMLIESNLQSHEYEYHDLSRNEAAKLHIRHMVGGKSNVKQEKLYRFRFPERPGALIHFLNHMEFDWNITLFHYRNHGSAFGRVLVGIQIPDRDEEKFNQFLEDLNFPCVDETHNPAFSFFL